MANRRNIWTTEQDTFIKYQRSLGKTFNEIASLWLYRFGGTPPRPDAIRKRLYYLNEYE